MRVLLVLRGSAGVGKSSWVKEHGLEPYTICPDDIRLMCQAPVLDISGKPCIGLDHEAFVWKMLFEMLEFRMQRGEFTVIDANCTKTSEINNYRNLAKQYRFRLYIVDFTDVPMEETKKRNLLREPLKQVPEEAIEKHYSRFATQRVPSSIPIIKPDELEKVFYTKADLNEYTRIHVIGDIHGCYTCLMDLINKEFDGLKDDELYIFVGDYIDRGIENAEVLEYLFTIMDKKNVILLAGNHSKSLYAYAHDERGFSKECEYITKPQLEDAGVDRKQCRILYSRLQQMVWFTYRGKNFIVTHGGISNIPKENIIFLATEQMIRGVGRYSEYEEVVEAFEKNVPDTIQIFGHRNTKSLPVKMSERTYNLEGKVEFGGYLRALTIYGEPVTNECVIVTHEVKNDVFKPMEEIERLNALQKTPLAELVMDMRNSKQIEEKRFGNISSFNFKRDVFEKKEWNAMTCKARGFYVNTNLCKVVARGYDKFFNINEREETKMDNLERVLKFPVTCYVKENGYLGLVSYNEETDDLFITTKSDPTGELAGVLKDAVYKVLDNDKHEPGFRKNCFKEFCRDNNVTFVFENIDLDINPHIIKYDSNKLFLLDIIYNDTEYKKCTYKELCETGKLFEFTVKERAYCIDNWTDFYRWYEEVTKPDYKYNNRYIEGFVIEDDNGYMTKLKLEYYNFWKFMRSITAMVNRKGYIDKTSALVTPEANYYYGWIRDRWEKENEEEKDHTSSERIIELRDLFHKDHPEFDK